VGFVSKSGGMSNEMYNVLSRATDGLFEGALVPLLVVGLAQRMEFDGSIFAWPLHGTPVHETLHVYVVDHSI
jgi:hypothetical protein